MKKRNRSSRVIKIPTANKRPSKKDISWSYTEVDNRFQLLEQFRSDSPKFEDEEDGKNDHDEKTRNEFALNGVNLDFLPKQTVETQIESVKDLKRAHREMKDRLENGPPAHPYDLFNGLRKNFLNHEKPLEIYIRNKKYEFDHNVEESEKLYFDKKTEKSASYDLFETPDKSEVYDAIETMKKARKMNLNKTVGFNVSLLMETPTGT